MIRIPRCFFCKNYIDGKQGEAAKCLAFPEGIPNNAFSESTSDNGECARGYHYVDERAGEDS